MFGIRKYLIVLTGRTNSFVGPGPEEIIEGKRAQSTLGDQRALIYAGIRPYPQVPQPRRHLHPSSGQGLGSRLQALAIGLKLCLMVRPEVLHLPTVLVERSRHVSSGSARLASVSALICRGEITFRLLIKQCRIDVRY